MPPAQTLPGLTYRDAGVDIDAGDALVQHQAVRQAHAARKCSRASAALAAWSISASDIATRFWWPGPMAWAQLMLAFALHRHDTVGIDLVAT
jgi:phosphoribosylformylglycinamidine cyclo-ligase